MTKWYKRYLQVYEKPFSEASENTINEVRNSLQKRQSETPLVTISLIAFNEEKHLLACLWSLSDMKCNYPVEIIGVDNDSSDRTADVFRAVGIPFYTETRHSCGFARLCGLNHSRGKYHINIDSDTLYPPHYVERMVHALEKPGIVAVSSLWSYMPDKNHHWLTLKGYELSRDIYLFLQSFKRPELSVRGLVFAYHADYAKKIGIRTDIKRGEDGSLALELKKMGKITFIRHPAARAVTGYGTVSADGSLLKSFIVRLSKGVKGMGGFFTKKEKYTDKNDNLIGR